MLPDFKADKQQQMPLISVVIALGQYPRPSVINTTHRYCYLPCGHDLLAVLSDAGFTLGENRLCRTFRHINQLLFGVRGAQKLRFLRINSASLTYMHQANEIRSK
jgi:hypothetical protein